MNLTPDLATLLLPFRKPPPNGSPPLRVGVVLDRSRPWTDSLVAILRQIPGIDVQLLTLAHSGPFKPTRPGWLVDRLYSASRAKFDPFGNLVTDRAEGVPPESLGAIRDACCDILIWLASWQDSDLELRSVTKQGVFTVRLGARNRAIPFWDEVAESTVTSTATINWHDASFALGRAVRTAETATLPGLFVTANAEQPVIAIIRMLAELCLEIRSEGRLFLERGQAVTLPPLAGSAGHDIPSNFEAAQFAFKKLARSAHLRWTSRGKTPQWFIAMRPNSGESIADPARLNLTGFKEVALPPGVEAMADPFLWESGGREYLLFEEIAAGQSRGRLGCVEVLQDGACTEMKIILERPYHLSYPCLVPSGSDLFLMPETAAANRVEVYRFSRFPWELELVSAPIEGAALVDTTPVFVDGRWYFFTTTIEPFMETLLFSATRLEGPWSLHPRNPISTSVRSCRSAGQLFWRDGRLFRPTQDCSVRYGYAIAVNEVIKLTPEEFEERPVNYVPPSWMPGLLGTHTWNESSRWQVIDGIR